MGAWVYDPSPPKVRCRAHGWPSPPAIARTSMTTHVMLMIRGGFGRIDCVVNGTGMPVKSCGDLLDVSLESFDLNFAVSVWTGCFLTQAICRKMLAAEGDFLESKRSVLFVSSRNAAIAAPEQGE
jgi:NAD(P)-dependent dehydrogenase (short-subunit alcohol dehydrogenase family)